MHCQRLGGLLFIIIASISILFPRLRRFVIAYALPRVQRRAARRTQRGEVQSKMAGGVCRHMFGGEGPRRRHGPHAAVARVGRALVDVLVAPGHELVDVLVGAAQVGEGELLEQVQESPMHGQKAGHDVGLRTAAVSSAAKARVHEGHIVAVVQRDYKVGVAVQVELVVGQRRRLC